MPKDNLKVPSQVFLWFEKMKNNYENSVQVVLRRFESFTETQQERVDSANHQHISNLKLMHGEQNQQSQDTISHFKNDIEFYKKQVILQQKTIEQLNTRYDAMMSCLLTEKRQGTHIKDIFTSDQLHQSSNPQETPLFNPLNQDITHKSIFCDDSNLNEKLVDNATDIILEKCNDSDDVFKQAIIYRNQNEQEKAFYLFQQAAQNGHVKAMGAMGRAYFLSEGVNENKKLGLAWLINAAEQKLPQAISRVEELKEQKPILYLQAFKIAGNLIK
jgi:hypothetical protein